MMDSDYYFGVLGYNAGGFTLSPEQFGPEDGSGYLFVPEGFEPEKASIIYEGEKSDGKDSVTDLMSQPFTILQPAKQTSPEDDKWSVDLVDKCPVYFSLVLVLLAGTGLIASILAYMETIIRWKKHRHYHNFLHILVSSICILLPIPFTAVSRLSGEWIFGDAWFKVLAVIADGAQTVCGFQLASLVLIHCREVNNGKEVATSVWNKIICYVLWLIALAFSWPCAVYDSILSDVVKGNVVSERRSFGASLYMKINLAVSYMFPSLVVLLCVIAALLHKGDKEDEKEKKIPLRILRGIKEGAILFALFFVCWLPYRAWRITTLSFKAVPGCGVPPDIFLFFGVAFCTLMPIVHYGLNFNQRVSEKRLEVSMTELIKKSGDDIIARNDSKDDFELQPNGT